MKYLRELVAYGCASAAALLVDYSLLYYLVRVCRLGAVPAASISFAAGAAVAYVLAVRFAFSQHRISSRRTEFLVFCLLGLVGLAVNAGVIALGVSCGLDPLVAKIGAAGATFLCNFLLRRQVLFVVPDNSRNNSHVFAE